MPAAMARKSKLPTCTSKTSLADTKVTFDVGKFFDTSQFKFIDPFLLVILLVDIIK